MITKRLHVNRLHRLRVQWENIATKEARKFLSSLIISKNLLFGPVQYTQCGDFIGPIP